VSAAPLLLLLMLLLLPNSPSSTSWVPPPLQSTPWCMSRAWRSSTQQHPWTR
jgi:hypothetical protein